MKGKTIRNGIQTRSLKLWHGFEPRLLEYSDIRIQRPNQLDHRSLLIAGFTVFLKPMPLRGYCSITYTSWPTRLERCRLPSSVVSALSSSLDTSREGRFEAYVKLNLLGKHELLSRKAKENTGAKLG